MYREGEGVAKNDKNALQWFRLAADQGMAQAQSNVGAMYNEGKGVAQNEKEALKWLRLAADQGFPEAQYNLGVMYREGEGVAKNDKNALQWFRLAADQGMAQAQFILGFMYEEGHGVAQSDKEAIKWYQKAGDEGHKLARSNLAALKYYCERHKGFPVLRFQVGSRVQCLIQVGSRVQWASGVVVKLHYREIKWAPEKRVPYQVQLDDGRFIYATVDSDRSIRRRGAP